MILVFLVSVGSAAGVWVAVNSSGGKGVQAPNSTTDIETDANTPTEEPIQLDPSGEAYQELRRLETLEEKMNFLMGLKDEPWLTPQSSVLIRAMDSKEPHKVQKLAFDITLDLALEKDLGYVPDVLQRGLDSSNPEIRRYALYKCRENPRQEMLRSLLRISRSAAEENFLALDALAEIDDDLCRERIYEVAANEKEAPRMRHRAMTLLATIKHPEGWGLLSDLSNSDDEELRRLAVELLKAYQSNEPDD